ncbi:hypothetical protein K502DRAFT_340974 [Neoconidiobolus thromboides FSU 785]|nr:hypothetical protein K502DRAFT_340974 [Neoconidiobolus thromboides FSU 785]
MNENEMKSEKPKEINSKGNQINDKEEEINEKENGFRFKKRDTSIKKNLRKRKIDPDEGKEQEKEDKKGDEKGSLNEQDKIENEINEEEIKTLLELRSLIKPKRGVKGNLNKNQEKKVKKNQAMESFTNSTILLNMEHHMNNYISSRLNQTKDPTLDLEQDIRNENEESNSKNNKAGMDKWINSNAFLTKVQEVDLNDEKIKSKE